MCVCVCLHTYIQTARVTSTLHPTPYTLNHESDGESDAEDISHEIINSLCIRVLRFVHHRLIGSGIENSLWARRGSHGLSVDLRGLHQREDAVLYHTQ